MDQINPCSRLYTTVYYNNTVSTIFENGKKKTGSISITNQSDILLEIMGMLSAVPSSSQKWEPKMACSQATNSNYFLNISKGSRLADFKTSQHKCVITKV